MIYADRIEVDDDEGRIMLIVYTNDGALNIDIHDTVLQFYAEVQKHIRPYVLEAESARIESARMRNMPQPVTNRPVSVEDAVEAGYALDDPKSPGFHDRMVGDA